MALVTDGKIHNMDLYGLPWLGGRCQSLQRSSVWIEGLQAGHPVVEEG